MLQYLKELMPIFRKASTKIGKILEITKKSPLKDVKGARRIFYSLMIDRKVNQTEISSNLCAEVLFLFLVRMWHHTFLQCSIRTSHLTHWQSS